MRKIVLRTCRLIKVSTLPPKGGNSIRIRGSDLSSWQWHTWLITWRDTFPGISAFDISVDSCISAMCERKGSQWPLISLLSVKPRGWMIEPRVSSEASRDRLESMGLTVHAVYRHDTNWFQVRSDRQRLQARNLDDDEHHWPECSSYGSRRNKVLFVFFFVNVSTAVILLKMH